MEGCSGLGLFVLWNSQFHPKHRTRNPLLDSRPHYLDLPMREPKACLPEGFNSNAEHVPCFLPTERQVINEGRMDKAQCGGCLPNLRSSLVQNEISQCGTCRSSLRQVAFE